jgi:hypothetical protein
MRTIRLLFLTLLGLFVDRKQKEPPKNSVQKNSTFNWKIVNPEVAFW